MIRTSCRRCIFTEVLIPRIELARTRDLHQVSRPGLHTFGDLAFPCFADFLKLYSRTFQLVSQGRRSSKLESGTIDVITSICCQEPLNLVFRGIARYEGYKGELSFIIRTSIALLVQVDDDKYFLNF